MRSETVPIRIGAITIGGGNPVAVQSMCNTDTLDIASTVKQINDLQGVGCELVRVAIPSMQAAKAFGRIRALVDSPLIACVQFDYRLAIEAIEQGADKVRITPSNIGSRDNIKEVVAAAKAADIPLRVGVNSGSLPQNLLDKHGYENIDKAMAENALDCICLLEDLGFDKIVVSVKSTDVMKTIRAYRAISGLVRYPLHIGVTEAGASLIGSIKSAIGIGTLLEEGIGDTIRVSLTASPLEEVKVAWEILKALDLRQFGVNIVSCPTCARTKIDIIQIEREIRELTSGITVPIRICLMGCIVNGPGESKYSDIGVVGGQGRAVLYRQGKRIQVVRESEVVEAVLEQVRALAESHMSLP